MNRPKVTENKSKNEQSDPVRLDKWLWAARFYKNRSLAREMIEGGKVQYNGQRSKPGKAVEIGALLTIRQGTDDKQVIVNKLVDKRGNATIAAELYTETEQSVKKRELNAQARKVNALYNPHPDSKPDKKQRRELIRAKHQ